MGIIFRFVIFSKICKKKKELSGVSQGTYYKLWKEWKTIHKKSPFQNPTGTNLNLF